jgi:hypothetical protein
LPAWAADTGDWFWFITYTLSWLTRRGYRVTPGPLLRRKG